MEKRSVAQIPGKSARATSTSVMCLYQKVEAAHLIVIQSQSFAIFKMLFAMPACANSRNHLWQSGPFGGQDEVVRFLVGISQAATNEQPMAPIIFPPMQHGNVRPVEEPGAFASFTHREALPSVGSKQEHFHLCCFHPPANPIRSHDPDWFGASQPPARKDIHSLLARCAGPGCLHRPCLPPPRQSVSGHCTDAPTCVWPVPLWSGSAPTDVDTSSLTALTVLCPVQGQVEFAINERMPSGGDIGEKDAHLTILADVQWFRNTAPRRLPTSSPVWENSFRR